jgi:hypothetical protein
MNPNQMMMAKAMVAQEALREEASRSREARRSGQHTEKARTERTEARSHSFLDILGLALPGRR